MHVQTSVTGAKDVGGGMRLGWRLIDITACVH